MLRVRLDPIAKDLRVMVAGGTREAQSRLVAGFARQEIAKADDINRRALGRVVPKEITVDGRKGVSLETVKPNGGVIISEWEIFSDVLVWIARTLAERSPKRSGEYLAGHRLFADGAEIAATANPPQAQEYVFVNVVPYARRLEIGKTKSGRPFLIQVENRIYERTARDAQRRFGNVAGIRFAYRNIVGDIRAPAIVVRVKV